METKKTRSRTKSANSDNPPITELTEIDMAPNLNGNKDGGKEKESVPEPEIPDEITEPEEVSPKMVTRKRKASEMKSDDAANEETDRVKEPKELKDDTEIEKEVAPPPPKEKENIADEDIEAIKEMEANNEANLELTESAMDTKIDGDESSANDSASSEVKDIAIPDTKQSLGKGRRARVPNKRYSDISFSKNAEDRIITTPRSNKSENGQFEDSKEESESENKPIYTASPQSTQPSKKKTTQVDLTNPNFLNPFKFGWKRELVYRATNDGNSGKRNGDIYYYTPSGKKARSMREVSENLKNKDLTLDDFTFFKEPLGLDDPEKEIIRDAKLKSAAVMPARKVLTPKTKSARVAAKTPVTPVPEPSPKVVKSPRVTGGFKVKVGKGPATKAKETKKSKDKLDDADMEIGTYPPNWTSPNKKPKPNLSLATVDNKPCRPCSIRCEGVSGLIPTLQCRLCLCLYHNECVGILPNIQVQAYVCKNCQMEQDPTNASDGASVIPTTLAPANLQITPPVLAPNLSEIAPPVISKPPPINPPAEMPKLVPKPSVTAPKYMKIADSGVAATVAPTGSNKANLLGSVTTWFPASSTIQVDNEDAESASPEPPRPQLVEYIGNKKYLIVPRHNILSVSPYNSEKFNKSDELNDSNDKSFDSGGGDNNNSEIDVKIESDVLTNESLAAKLLSHYPSPLSPLNAFAARMAEQGHLVNLDDVTRLAAAAASITEETRSTLQATLPSPSKQPRLTPKVKSLVMAEKTRPESSKFMDTYLQNLAYGYKTLLCVFQYLKVQDLLRAGCVCTMWRDVARHSLLWSTVRMKNSQIHRFDGLANALQKHGTVHLDLRKMLLPTNGSDDIWASFTSAIKKVDSLRKIELCRCLASVVEELATNNHNLEAINAVTIKCELMNFDAFANLANLTDLRLKSTSGFTLKSDLSALKQLTKLKHLSITSIKDLDKLNIDVIGELVNLEVLDLGECTDFPRNFGPEILANLKKLEKLRLEKGQGECFTFDILEAVKDLPALQQLELVNFDIKAGFDKSLGSCINIKKLLIIPTYISQSATTNHMVLGGVLKLQKTLSHFVWGVTLELLRVTELFVDQCEQPDKKEIKEKHMNTGDSIPVLKPVPLHGIPLLEGPPTSDPPQVEILPLANLQKLLLQNLPTTRVKILKIPFHATWRQSITDSVN